METINKLKIVLILAFIVTMTSVKAQQQSQYTQFMNVGLVFNPAYAGANDHLNASLIGRWQWVGFEGAPSTQTLAVDSGIPNKNIGLGLVVSRDEVAVTNFTYARLNYAYHIPTLGGKLSMGVSASYNNFSNNFDQAFVVDPDAVFAQNASSSSANFGVGFNFQKENLWVGISVPEILHNTFEENGVELFSQKRHIYVSGGYMYPITESVSLRANTLLRFVAGSPLAADFNVMAWHNDRIGAGLSHRLDESIDLVVQFKTNKDLAFGYAFDYVTNTQLSNLAKTSHEFMITYAAPWSEVKKKTNDADNDGIKNKEDDCPNTAGPTSNNGCPLPDTDGDGVPDGNDKCPNLKGRVDSGGCPDTDGDGIIDKEDECPKVAGTKANNGCSDGDQDGVLDHLDQCPNVAGLSKFAGCPDTDNDGIKDSEDNCPNEAGLASNNGCPGISEETKRVLAQALEGVQFESSKDVLKASSYAVLENVVKVLKDNPQYRLKVSGYTDSSGGDDINLRLSKERANGVKAYFINNGVESNRIEADGFGEINPVADNETKEGRAKNRRVEFEILL